jgi:DNA repair exonuclease SbcCD nuclease subunit
MKSFIFFTDVHIRLTSPRRRTDDIFEAQLSKLEWIAQRAEELKCSFVVCGGDVGDAWDWKISMVNKVADTLRKFTVPVYTILGNHDVPGRNPDLWKDTGLGLLDQMGVIKILHKDSKSSLFQYCTDQKGQLELLANPVKEFVLVPFHSDAKETDDLIKGRYRKKAILDTSLRVAIVHAPIGAETTPFCKGHKELFISDFDVALFGDIHPGWPVYDSITGCKICNPGSLTRLNKTDMDRKPQIAVVYENGDVVYEGVPHLHKDDCFDVPKMDAEKTEIGKGFLAAIAAKKLIKDTDPKEYVEKIGSAAKYSRESIDLLKKEL